MPLARSVSACPCGPSLCRPEASACALRRVNNFIDITGRRSEAPRVDAAPTHRTLSGSGFEVQPLTAVLVLGMLLLPFCLSRFASRTWEGQGAPNSFGRRIRKKLFLPPPHTPKQPAQTPLQWSSHPDTHTHHTHTRTLPQHTPPPPLPPPSHHHTTRPQHSSLPLQSERQQETQVQAERKKKFRSTKKLGFSAGTTLLHGAARAYQRCGQHECPSGSASCAWCGQTDIHRESSASTRRKRAKNQEDERHRTTSTPVTVDPLSTSTVSCGNFPTSPSPSITTEQTHSHTAQAGAFHTLLAHAFHTLHHTRTVPSHLPRLSRSLHGLPHPSTQISHLSPPSTHKKIRDWSRVIRRSAKFLLLLLQENARVR